jgi:HK97 family phage portal protein
MPLQTGLFADLIAEEARTAEAIRAALAEKRSSLENPQTPLSYPAEWLLDIFNGGRTDSGIRVSELTALQASTVLTCVDLISGKTSSLPFHVLERSMTASKRAIHRVAYEHEYYEVVAEEPNPEMSRQTFLKAFLCHCLLWGNGYAEIQRGYGGVVTGIWPRNPSKTRPRRITEPMTLPARPWRPYPVELPAWSMVYETTDGVSDQDVSDNDAASGYMRLIAAEDMLHVPGLSLDGRVGQSTVWLAREIIGQALVSVKFGSKYFANYARPGGILELPAMKPEDRNLARQSWQEAQGGENAHRVAAMPVGTKWTQVTSDPEKAQSLELQAFVRTQIAATFHVPNRMAGDNTHASKGSTEQENQELLDYTLSPWLNAIKQEWKRKLFPHPGVGRRPKSPFYVDFDTSGLVRANAADREKFNASGKQWGYLSTNDIRASENLNPIEEPWADEYWMPINMTLPTTPYNPEYPMGEANAGQPGGSIDKKLTPQEDK